MAITFDTIADLKEFCATFITTTPSFQQSPDLQLALQPTDSTTENTIVADAAVDSTIQPPKKRGPKPKLKNVLPPILPPVTVNSVLPPKIKNLSITARIKHAVDKHMAKKNEFTANSIYDQLVKQDVNLKKHTVVTSVLKLMSQVYREVPTELRASSGPRPIKVYLPQ
jgi:hypothetical protein